MWRWLLPLLLVGACNRAPLAREYAAEVTTLAGGGPGLPFYVGRDLRPEWKPTHSVRRLEEFQLKDQNARRFGNEALRGKVAIVSFFFTQVGSPGTELEFAL